MSSSLKSIAFWVVLVVVGVLIWNFSTKFQAHDELGSGIGDRVRIVETRPLPAQKRWRVVEILQKAAK